MALGIISAQTPVSGSGAGQPPEFLHSVVREYSPIL